MSKVGVYTIIMSLCFLAVVEGCTISLCQRYCAAGFYEETSITPSGLPCNCRCCPPVTCRSCFMRKKVIARDDRGCVTCRCGWPL